MQEKKEGLGVPHVDKSLKHTKEVWIGGGGGGAGGGGVPKAKRNKRMRTVQRMGG